MKARISIGPNAGCTIEVVPIGSGLYRSGEKIYSAGELDIISEEPDWSAFRREAAKDILPAMINWRRINEAGANLLISKGEVVKLAIEYADELIKQLRDDTED